MTKFRRRAFGRGRRQKQRAKDGMNNTEAAFEQFYLKPRIASGELLDYRYEALTLKLAENTRLTVDFPALTSEGEVVLYEVKANWKGKPHIEDDANVKLKVVAEQWWFRVVVVWPTDKTKQHWHTKEV